jgi:hypothetical protein
MKKTIKMFAAVLFIAVYGCALASASTLSGYALKGTKLASDPSARWGGALVEFKDVVTKQPVKVEIVTGKKVEGRNDALYATEVGDIGKWKVKIKQGKYLATISGKDGGPSYKLMLYAMPLDQCDIAAATGYVNVKLDCGAAGNGSTDDTGTIAAAISKIEANGGGVLYFPKGNYIVGSSSATIGMLPFQLPSGITIQGTNGATYNLSNLGNTRVSFYPSVTLGSSKAVFRIGEGKHQITFRDITLLGVHPSDFYNNFLDKSTAVVGEGNAPNSSYGVLFSNMSIRGFQTGVNVKGCVSTTDDCTGVWQLDNIKADHVYFNCATGIKMNTPNTDWEISNSWFAMYGLSVASASSGKNRGMSVLAGGHIQVNNTFGGGTASAVGGDFIYVESVGGFTIVNSQTENVTNSIVWGRDPTVQFGAGTTIARLVVIGSQFGDPIRLRQIVNYISLGSHYGPQTIKTENRLPDPNNPGQTIPNPNDPLIRIYSFGDKFCNNGYDPNQNPNEEECAPPGITPGVQGPATVFFQTGQWEETNQTSPIKNNPEMPNKIGFRTEVKDPNIRSTNPVFSITAPNGVDSNNMPFTRPLLRLGQSDSLSYSFSRNKDNGFLEILASQSVPWKGIKINSLIQFVGITWNELQGYGTASPGAMVFCTNCKAGTNGVCVEDTASNPEGAFAKLYNLVWKCN